MKHSSSLKHRVREIETARGAGALNLRFSDGSKQGFNLSRNDRLKVLLASFDIALASRNPTAVAHSSPKAIAVARAIGRAAEVSPPEDRLWQTVGGIVRGAEEDERAGTSHAPDPASS